LGRMPRKTSEPAQEAAYKHGDVIDGREVRDVLGAGGFGVVCLVYHSAF
jgi:hypothetical protein